MYEEDGVEWWQRIGCSHPLKEAVLRRVRDELKQSDFCSRISATHCAESLGPTLESVWETQAGNLLFLQSLSNQKICRPVVRCSTMELKYCR